MEISWSLNDDVSTLEECLELPPELESWDEPPPETTVGMCKEIAAVGVPEMLRYDRPTSPEPFEIRSHIHVTTQIDFY
jgi:hypothetical protein